MARSREVIGQPMHFSKALGVAAALALTTISLICFTQEYGAFALSRDNVRGQFRRLDQGEVRMGPSIRAQTAVMRACDESQRSLFGRVQSASARRALAERCISLAGGALANAPTSSLAHYVIALSQLRLGNYNEFNEALATSQQAGPVQGWIAERRFDIGVQGYGHLDEIGRGAIALDVTQLISSDTGRTFIADRFALNEPVREFVLSQAETRPAADQQLLVTAISDALNRITRGN